VDGNVAGRAAYNASLGTFTIPVLGGGLYRIDYGVSFSAATASVAGTSVVIAVRVNGNNLTNATYTFPVTSTAASVNSLNSWYTASFTAGDIIVITALYTAVAPAVATSLNGTAVTNVAPFNTLLAIRSLF